MKWEWKWPLLDRFTVATYCCGDSLKPCINPLLSYNITNFHTYSDIFVNHISFPTHPPTMHHSPACQTRASFSHFEIWTQTEITHTYTYSAITASKLGFFSVHESYHFIWIYLNFTSWVEITQCESDMSTRWNLMMLPPTSLFLHYALQLRVPLSLPC